MKYNLKFNYKDIAFRPNIALIPRTDIVPYADAPDQQARNDEYGSEKRYKCKKQVIGTPGDKKQRKVVKASEGDDEGKKPPQPFVINRQRIRGQLPSAIRENIDYLQTVRRPKADGRPQDKDAAEDKYTAKNHQNNCQNLPWVPCDRGIINRDDKHYTRPYQLDQTGHLKIGSQDLKYSAAGAQQDPVKGALPYISLKNVEPTREALRQGPGGDGNGVAQRHFTEAPVVQLPKSCEHESNAGKHKPHIGKIPDYIQQKVEPVLKHGFQCHTDIFEV